MLTRKASLGQDAFASARALEVDIALLDAGADGPNGAGAGEEARLSQPAPSPEERACMGMLLDGDDGVHGEGDRGVVPLRWFGYWLRSNCCCCW